MEKNNTEDKRKSKKRDQQEELPAKGPTRFDDIWLLMEN